MRLGTAPSSQPCSLPQLSTCARSTLSAAAELHPVTFPSHPEADEAAANNECNRRELVLASSCKSNLP